MASDPLLAADDLDSLAPEPLFSVQDLVGLQSNIEFYTAPVLAWIHRPVGIRDPTELPTAIQIIEGTLRDLRRLELNLPAPFFYRLERRLDHTLDVLEALQKDKEGLFGVCARERDTKWIKKANGYWAKDVDLQQLSLFCNTRMKQKEMSEHLGLSLRTIKRRIQELGIGPRKFKEVSDEDLKAYVLRAIRLGSGQQGYRGIWTRLRKNGVQVPRNRVQQVCKDINRSAVVSKWTKACVRRTYRVPFINSLWHMDGHHKLIRWKIVIHGCIDGFSRMITFMKASNNNRAETVTQQFEEAVKNFGWPSRIRVDYGKENLGVKRRMEEVRGLGRGSFIQGPSTRNQRIERLWVDLQDQCTKLFKTIFTELENNGELDVDNPLQMWALHFSYMPILNWYLRVFHSDWNDHSIRTAEQSASPSLLWLWCVLEAEKLGIDPLANPLAYSENDIDLPGHAQRNFKDYGLDDYGDRARGQPKDTDPYIEVEPILARADLPIKQLLDNEDFQREMHARLGPAGPMQDDDGKMRYRLCCNLLAEAIGREQTESA